MKKLFLMILGLVNSAAGIDFGNLNQYYFLLLTPKNSLEYKCFIFPLERIKVCLFPNGPVVTNTLSQVEAVLPVDEFNRMQRVGFPLSVLCIDQNRAGEHLCGFALPWRVGVACVFENIAQPDQMLGLVIEKKVFRSFLQDEFPEYVEDQELDDLLENENNRVVEEVVWPFPFQQLKRILGPIFISSLIYYYELKAKIQGWIEK